MKNFGKIFTASIAVALCLALSGCDMLLYSYDENGDKHYSYSVDTIERRFSAAECRAEAERLFGMPFDIVKRHKPFAGQDLSSFVLRSEELPFDITVYSEHIYRKSGDIQYLSAHAFCDYYEKMMDYKQEEAKKLAKSYALEVTRKGQDASVCVSSFSQLENVYEYLNATNELYDFTVVESEMTNILRDIRSRPTLTVYYKSADAEREIIKLYYTINHETYNYTKSGLLPTICETYIEKTDALGAKDKAVTEEVRSKFCKPALTKLYLNGEPLPVKDCGSFTLDPNIVFDYNWLMDDYYGDVRLCMPARNYDLPPDEYLGDDRNFRYLVSLLGGEYTSQLDGTSSLPDYYTAEWTLGGDSYGAGSFYQQKIPTMSAFDKNGKGISVSHSYSKEMWGLENGYGPEDFFIRLTPKGLGTLLGVEVEADYESGVLNLITPEGYFDAAVPTEAEPDETKPADTSSRFFVEDIVAPSKNRQTHYIIYKADGTIMEEDTTHECTVAECVAINDSIVLLKTGGYGSLHTYAFFDTASGEISDIYYSAELLAYPYILHIPQYSGKICVENVLTGSRKVLVNDADNVAPPYTDLSFDAEKEELTVTYFIKTENENVEDRTKTFQNVFPD